MLMIWFSFDISWPGSTSIALGKATELQPDMIVSGLEREPGSTHRYGFPVDFSDFR